MKINVVGYSVADFTSKKSGKPVKGYWLSYTYQDQRTTGLKAETVLFTDPQFIPKIGEADLNYNRNGFVDSVVFCK